MSYFSNLSHTNSYTSIEPHNNPISSSTPSSGFPRQRSSSSLRTNSKLSLSISASTDLKDRDKTLSGHPLTSQSARPATSVSSPTPLRRTWVFWFRQQRVPSNKITNYEEGIKKITAFSSVESFWSLQTHLNPPTALVPTTDYLLFHDGVKRPVWEDPLNANGGKWIIRLRKGVSDRLWEDLIVAVIGDQFEPEDGVCGCVLSVRSNEDILSIWNRDDKDSEAKARIRDGVRRLLNLPSNVIMEYKSNNDSMTDKSSFRTTSSQSIVTLSGLGLPPVTPS